MTIDKTLREIKRMLEQAEREGYQRGWKDAARSIVSSAQSLSAPAVPATAKPKSTKRRTGKRVRRGTVPSTILMVLHRRDGLTYAEIIKESGTKGKQIPGASVRSAMLRLQKDGEVRRENNQWFLAQRPLTQAAGQEDGDAEPSPSDLLTKHNGGEHATA